MNDTLDEQGFRTLYREHSPALYRFALRLTGGSEADASELVQETWVRAVRKLDTFEGRSSFRTWLHGIASRCASEEARRQRRHPLGAGVDALEAKGSAVEATLDLERAVASLPVGFRAVLVLYDVEGYRHREIAEMLGISRGTSKSQLSRARARVRALLGEEYVIP